MRQWYRGRIVTTIRALLCLILLALVVDKDERDEDDAGADPIGGAGELGLQNHLTDEGEGNGQAKADRDDER